MPQVRVWKEEGQVSHVGLWRLRGDRKRCHIFKFLRVIERREKKSHVTVSAVYEDKGKCVTCYGFRRLGALRKGATC